MQVEQMEAVLDNYIRTRSSQLGRPLGQAIHLVNGDNGIKVGREEIEISVQIILDGMSLQTLVERLILLDDELFHKQREEKRRKIETEKLLARAHILELKRLCCTHEFNNYLQSFLGGELEKR